MFDLPQKFYELCRLCLSPDGVKYSIFEEGGTQQDFAQKISACLSITVRYAAACDNPHFIGRDHLWYLLAQPCVRLSVCVVLIVAVLSPSLSLSLDSLTRSVRSLVRSALEALSRALYRETRSRSLLVVSL